MTENIAKAQFLNFLLSKKYGTAQMKNPIIEGHLVALKAPKELSNFRSNFSEQDLLEWLKVIEPVLDCQDEQLKDLIFGILYSSDLFPKLVKAKNFPLAKTSEFYKAKFQENKKLLAEFNSKDQGKIKINAPSKIVTRFPPEPSGYLHIGHAKAALLNQFMAKDGELLIRFDDTNPEKESTVFENAILEDLKLLKIETLKLSHSSDYFDTLFEYACRMIKEGKAYVDNTDVDTMRQERTDGIPSKNRELSSEESLRIFQAMKNGEYPEYCLRAKISFDNLNKAMRDPVIYRHIDMPHHYTGTKYKIYPTYDLTCPVLDSIEGVTLTLRSNEYHDRNDQYFWFIDNLGLKNRPELFDFSRLNFENTVISKRKMKFYVENNYVTGWDDPRMCSLRGLSRLGMNMGAMREYILQQGASQKNSVVSWDKVWALNKKTIDPNSIRVSAVPLKDFVTCFIESGADLSHPLWISGEDKIIEIAKHKKNPALGNKKIILTNEILISQEDAAILEVGEEFTLMNWGNVIISKKEEIDGKVVSLRFKLNLNGDYKTTKNKITWITKKGSVLVKLYEYGNLQNDLDTDDLHLKFNVNSKNEEWWLMENTACDVKPTETIQIERIGFFICDKHFEFNLIPFTKQKRTE